MACGVIWSEKSFVGTSLAAALMMKISDKTNEDPSPSMSCFYVLLEDIYFSVVGGMAPRFGLSPQLY
jgi:hypothetical protein